jgi:hypothetical protein
MKTLFICGYKPNERLIEELNIKENYNEIFVEDNLFPSLAINNFDEVLFKDTTNKYLFTNNPYILNYLNLLIIRYDKTGVGLKFEDTEVIFNDDMYGIEYLKALNERIINTNVLSDTINEIYDEYNKLTKL